MFKYDEELAVQASAYLVKKYDGKLNYMKLIKLLYLANREALQKANRPIVPDRFVSMPHGPVLSRLLDSINYSEEGSFFSSVFDVQDHSLALKADPGVGRMNRFSLAILDRIDERWHLVDQYSLAKWTHDNCPEWTDPDGSSYDISFRKLFHALGKSSEEIDEIIEEEDIYERESAIISN